MIGKETKVTRNKLRQVLRGQIPLKLSYPSRNWLSSAPHILISRVVEKGRQ